MTQAMARHALPFDKRKLWWLSLPALAVAVPLALFGWDLFKLYSLAGDLEQGAASAQSAVAARDLEALKVEAASLSTTATAFASHTDGPLWDAAAVVPWLGDQVVPVQAAADAMVVLVDDVLAPLGDGGSLAGLQLPTVVDGRLDPDALTEYLPTLERAAAALEQQDAALHAVDTTGAVEPVAAAVDRLHSEIVSLRPELDAAVIAAKLLPTMAGGEGERQYLVMVQNNAEPRALGGIPGAVFVLTVDDGRFDLGEYFNAAQLGQIAEDPLVAREDEVALFTSRIERFPQNTTFTPEFPRAAQLTAQFVQRYNGLEVDGVISIDPVALGYVLADAPARDIAGVQVSGANLAQVMLNEVYFRFEDPAAQDAFFQAAAGALFSEVLSGGAGMIPALERATEEGRFMVWSAHEDEQELLAPTTMGGDFMTMTDAAGVFINDGSGTKIGYYLDVAATSEGAVCRVGEQTLLTVEVSHTFAGPLETLPPYLAGDYAEVPFGWFGGNVLVYPPQGYAITNVTLDGQAVATRGAVHGERSVTQMWIELEPGATGVIQYTLVLSEEPAQWDVTVVTPGARDTFSPRTLVTGQESC